MPLKLRKFLKKFFFFINFYLLHELLNNKYILLLLLLLFFFFFFFFNYFFFFFFYKYIYIYIYVFSGIILRRWKPFEKGQRCDIEIVMWANYIYVKNEDRFFDTNIEDEKKKDFEKFWEHYKDNVMAGMKIKNYKVFFFFYYY